ncbi:MAG: glycosyltransferase [Candidatus Methanomethylicia archaeon]|nr:glycosyltransferase [Candidatus Methanomethylicia archaeon]
MNSNQFPFVTVNILAYNRKEEVDITLRKILYNLEYPKDRYEVIVVDNASTDGTYEMIKTKYPEVKVIRLEKNIGIAGWNEGFKAGKGDYFLVLDDDAYIEGDTLLKLVNRAIKYNANLISMRVVNPYSKEDFTELYPTGLLSFWGCSVLIDRKVIDTIGYYDENIFIWAHELEYSIRLLNSGLIHCYSPDIIAYHMKQTIRDRDNDRIKLSHRMNFRHFFYISGKYFQGKYLFKSLFNLITTALYINLKNFYRGVFNFRDVKQNVKDYIIFYKKGRANRIKTHDVVQKAYLNSFIEFQNLLYRRYSNRFYLKNSKFYPNNGSYIIKFRKDNLDIIPINY